MKMSNSIKDIIIVIILSILGGIFKILGGLFGNSKSVFVDAMTSIANTISILLIYKYFRMSLEPPDRDHLYGHHRLVLGGSISTLLLYSFVGGIILLDIIEGLGTTYTVYIYAPIFATLGMAPYLIGIAISRKIGGSAILYARFTVIELIEGLTTIFASLGGVFVSYIIDFVGAIALTSYLFIELVKSFREILSLVSDEAPKEIVEKVRKSIEKHGVEFDKIRIRRIVEDVYHGDIVLKLPPNTNIETAHRIADSIENELKKNLGIDVTIHIEPNEKNENQ